jgi:hypothetical protein
VMAAFDAFKRPACLSQISEQFLHSLALGIAVWQSRHFSPNSRRPAQDG